MKFNIDRSKVTKIGGLINVKSPHAVQITGIGDKVFVSHISEGITMHAPIGQCEPNLHVELTMDASVVDAMIKALATTNEPALADVSDTRVRITSGYAEFALPILVSKQTDFVISDENDGYAISDAAISRMRIHEHCADMSDTDVMRMIMLYVDYESRVSGYVSSNRYMALKSGNPENCTLFMPVEIARYIRTFGSGKIKPGRYVSDSGEIVEWTAKTREMDVVFQIIKNETERTNDAVAQISDCREFMAVFARASSVVEAMCESVRFVFDDGIDVSNVGNTMTQYREKVRCEVSGQCALSFNPVFLRRIFPKDGSLTLRVKSNRPIIIEYDDVQAVVMHIIERT